MSYPRHPAPWGYLLYHGPEKITVWTLEQTADDRIVDGCHALVTQLIGREKAPKDRVAAGDGLVRVVRKMREGWPGYTGVGRYTAGTEGMTKLPPPALARSLQNRIDGTYQSLAINAPNAADPGLAREVYLRLKPPVEDTASTAAWQRHGEEQGILPRGGVVDLYLSREDTTHAFWTGWDTRGEPRGTITLKRVDLDGTVVVDYCGTERRARPRQMFPGTGVTVIGSNPSKGTALVRFDDHR